MIQSYCDDLVKLPLQLGNVTIMLNVGYGYVHKKFPLDWWFCYAEEIKNNAWVTVNNDFLSRVRRFGNDFHEWRSHEWKSLPNRHTSDKKSLFTATNVLFYFLHAIWYHEHSIPPNQLSSADFAVVAKNSLFWFSIQTSPQLICDVTRM